MQKITLANLATATAQEVFNQVKQHLLTQKERSTKTIAGVAHCRYKSSNGLKCAAGCLIAESEYNPLYEGKVWAQLIQQFQFPTQHAGLISVLQSVHDTKEPYTWRESLQKVAKTYNLDF